MLAAAFILISLGWLGVYSGFTNRNPKDELVAAFGGKHSAEGSGSGAGDTSPPAGAQGPVNAHGVGGDAIAAEAKRYLGVKYRWGGNDPQHGFDCSGLVKYVHEQVGITGVPRTALLQLSKAPKHPGKANLQPGDLVFYEAGIGHVAICVGNGQVIHAPHTGTVVSYGSVNMYPVMGTARYW